MTKKKVDDIAVIRAKLETAARYVDIMEQHINQIENEVCTEAETQPLSDAPQDRKSLLLVYACVR